MWPPHEAQSPLMEMETEWAAGGLTEPRSILKTSLRKLTVNRGARGGPKRDCGIGERWRERFSMGLSIRGNQFTLPGRLVLKEQNQVTFLAEAPPQSISATTATPKQDPDPGGKGLLPPYTPQRAQGLTPQ